VNAVDGEIVTEDKVAVVTVTVVDALSVPFVPVIVAVPVLLPAVSVAGFAPLAWVIVTRVLSLELQVHVPVCCCKSEGLSDSKPHMLNATVWVLSKTGLAG
jgi:hypothetical protein